MKNKILIICLGILLIANTVTGMYLYISVKQSYRGQIEQKLSTDIDFIHNVLKLKSQNNGHVDYEGFVKEYSQITDCRITIVDENGKLVADSQINDITFKNFVYDTEILMAMNGETGSLVLVSPVDNKPTLFLAKPPVDIAGSRIIVRLGYTMDKMNNFTGIIFIIIATTIVSGIMIILITTYLLTKNLDYRLKDLAAITKSIVKGNLDKRIDIEVNNDIKPLVDNFNLMADKLNEMTIKTNERNSRINTIIASMGNGLLVVDNDNEVIMLNPQAEELIKVDKRIFFKSKADEIEEKRILTDIMSYTEMVIQNQMGKTATIRTEDDRLLEISVEAIKNKYEPYENSGALAVIKDVTEIKRLENLRVEFVSNVSHELRTPLTLISGFVETLKDWDTIAPEDRMKALDILGIETERLKQLISELLKLSKIESKLSRKRVETIDTEREIHEVKNSLTHMAEQKGIALKIDVQSPLKPLTGDRDWIKQIVINLCENAIKYSPGGSMVTVRAYCTDSEFILSVEDNGIGIPKEDIPRIFERFYRVDKARTSKIKGSGLGLAIVKHAVIELNGIIEVESSEGKGSQFVVKIPLRR